LPRAEQVRDERNSVTSPVMKPDVLCHPPGAVAGVGLLSSGSRSALRAAVLVAAASSIGLVAVRSGTGRDGWGW
jgi:hypothetical protein